nr:protein CutA homolog isoform X3 [Caretta caretta]
MKMDWLTQRCQLPAAQSCTRPGCFTLLLVITLSLLMYPVLKSLGLQLHSAVTGSYISGTHSIAFINCPNEQVAKDIARYFWEGEIEEATEILLLVKTRTSKISELSDYISVPTASCDLTLSSPPRPRKRSSSSTSRSPLRTGPRPFAKPKLVSWKSTPPWPTP